MYAAGLTDVGSQRSQNQDAIFVCNGPIGPLPNLFIVADGMGGHKAGDVASKMAVDLVSGYIRNFSVADLVQPEDYLDLLVNAAQHAGAAIYARSASNKDEEGMGTTLTACVIEDEKIIIAHIGDSRAYAIYPMHVTQLTTDHTYAEELLKAGRVSAEEASIHPRRHVLTRVLGTPGHLNIDGEVKSIDEATAILICSDGLSNMLDDDTMIRTVNGLGYVEHRARALIDEANRKGGPDNISAILIDVNR